MLAATPDANVLRECSLVRSRPSWTNTTSSLAQKCVDTIKSYYVASPATRSRNDRASTSHTDVSTSLESSTRRQSQMEFVKGDMEEETRFRDNLAVAAWRAAASKTEITASIFVKTEFQPPKMDFGRYAQRLFKYMDVWEAKAHGPMSAASVTMWSASTRALVFSLIIMDRCSVQGYQVGGRDVHRALAVGMLLHAKLVEDVPFNVAWWANVTGIPKAQLISLEREVLNACKHDVHVGADEMNERLASLCGAA